MGSLSSLKVVEDRQAVDGTVSVLVVEDDAMVLSWIRLALEESEFRIAGTAESAREALELVPRRLPDVVLVDFRLPDGAGTDLVRALRQEGSGIPAVLMTANAEPGFNELSREAGAQGSVLKTGRADDLLATLRAVADGREEFDNRHPRRDPGSKTLSPRERDVLRLVARGATNRQIAEVLEVGEETVKTLLSRIFLKLGVRRRAEAVSEAHSQGLL